MKQSFRVSNIHCEGCAANLVSALSMLDGVKDVSVDIKSRLVTVTYRAPLGSADIAQQLDMVGLEVEVVAE